MEILAELNQRGRTIIVVTHDPRITNFTNQIVYLIDGGIVSEIEYQEAIQIG